MKLKLLSIMAVLITALMACQGADDARGTMDNPNVDPTTFRGEGIYNQDPTQFDRDGDRNWNRFNRDGRMNTRFDNVVNNNDRYEIAEEAAERITDEIDEIDNAYVLTFGNNAYVAADIDRNDRTNRANRNQNNRFGDDEVSDAIKKRISKIVRSVDRDIENVYVSTNPDFIDLMTDYADDVDRGRPIEGFFDRIGNMIDRIFPENMENQGRVR